MDDELTKKDLMDMQAKQADSIARYLIRQITELTVNLDDGTSSTIHCLLAAKLLAINSFAVMGENGEQPFDEEYFDFMHDYVRTEALDLIKHNYQLQTKREMHQANENTLDALVGLMKDNGQTVH